MNHSRVKAFTIMEVTVTMLVAALIITITYTAFSIISRSYDDYLRKQEEMADLTRLDRWLKKDIGRAGLIFRSGNGLRLADSGRVIAYIFEKDLIIRTAGMTDTFRVTPQDLSFRFEQRTVSAAEDTSQRALVDELSFFIPYQDEKIPYHYQKQYSAANLISSQQDAIH